MTSSLLKWLKPYLRWVILGGTLFFITKTLTDHWQEVTHIQLSEQSIFLLPAAFIITLAAHTWSGWVWHWILAIFQQPQTGWWTTPIYLKTNVAKYLPGNVWHFWGRIRALQATHTPISIAILAVVIEPLLMAVAALIWACLCGNQIIGTHSRSVQLLILAGSLITIHPRIFNPILQTLSQAKSKAQIKTQGFSQSQSRSHSSLQQSSLQAYPLKPLLGEMGFVGARSLGFITVIAALTPVTPAQIPTLIAAFSLAWLLGLIVPGAPGGIGVFEATAIPLLSGQFPVAVVLSGVAIYRLISVLAEVSAAGLAVLIERFNHKTVD